MTPFWSVRKIILANILIANCFPKCNTALKLADISLRQNVFFTSAQKKYVFENTAVYLLSLAIFAIFSYYWMLLKLQGMACRLFDKNIFCWSPDHLRHVRIKKRLFFLWKDSKVHLLELNTVIVLNIGTYLLLIILVSDRFILLPGGVSDNCW